VFILDQRYVVKFPFVPRGSISSNTCLLMNTLFTFSQEQGSNQILVPIYILTITIYIQTVMHSLMT